MTIIKQLGAILLVCAFLAGYAFVQHEGYDKDKEKNKAHQQDKAKENKNKKQQKDVHKGHKDSKGNSDEKDKALGRDKDNSDARDEKDKNGDFIGGNGRDKITICHKPSRNPGLPVTIRVSERAWKAHEAHGDIRGECPPATAREKIADDDFFSRREVVYVKAAELEEVVLDSEDLLELARERVRRALADLEATRRNLADAELRERQEKVTRVEMLISEVAALVQTAREDIEVDVDLIEVDLVSK